MPTYSARMGISAGADYNLLGYNVDLITLIALLLFCGAVGKSARCLSMCGFRMRWKARHL